MADALTATFVCALLGALGAAAVAGVWLLVTDTWRALRDGDWQAEL